MTDDPKSVAMIQLTEVVGAAFSTEGKDFAMHLKDEDGDAIIVSLPISQFDSFLTAVQTLKDRRASVGAGPNQMMLRKVRSIAVGNSSENPGHLALIFEPNTPVESAFLLADAEAMRLIDRIRKDLSSRNDDQTRAHRMMAPKLILPPGMKQ